MEKKELTGLGESVLLHTYNRFDMVLDHGDGMYLYDIDGTEYLDFAAGIAVCAFGYNNKTYNDALKSQIDKLVHTSNLYYNEPSIKAAELFCKASGMDRVFFTNSGTEAIEGALKLARKYYYQKHGVADSIVIAMDHSFHGRSMGAVSVTGKKAYREAFEPLIGGVVFAEFNDYVDVLSKVNDKTAAIIMETVQGEGGIYPADKEFLQKIAALCKEKDIVLILDEIQCGMGRTGTMFAYQQYGVQPDIVTSAKALGCGVPVGCFAASEKVASAMVPGDHGSTYGGNPLVCKAVETVFNMFEETKILDHVNQIAKALWDELEAIKADYPIVTGHRGLGLMQGLEFSVPAGQIVKEVIRNKCILISASTNIIRFVPPLIVEECHIKKMAECLRKALDTVSAAQ
ncbi:MAG: aspartate aminotransferase family protein [Lachnospiraceae bacterium]|nr:aspartate aminotransferase family protein [Lachnospiraceae bacterium]